jgi:hypothetical protein
MMVHASNAFNPSERAASTIRACSSADDVRFACGEVVLLVSGGRLIEKGSLPAEPPYDVLITERPELPLSPGEHQEINVALSKEIGHELWFRGGFGKDVPIGSFLYFLGYIRFQDGNKTIRSMGFCRRYNPDTKKFTAVEDADYEYAD